MNARRLRKRGAEQAMAAGEAGQRRSVRQRSGRTGNSAGASRGLAGGGAGLVPLGMRQRLAAGSEGPRKRPAAAAAEEETYGGESAAAPNVSAPVSFCLCVCLRRAERRDMCGRILALMGLIRSRLTVEVLCE